MYPSNLRSLNLLTDRVPPRTNVILVIIPFGYIWITARVGHSSHIGYLGLSQSDIV